MEQIIKRKIDFDEAYREAMTMLPEVCLEVLRVQNREYYAGALVEYEQQYGQAGIIDMYAFFLYCKALKIDNRVLVLSLAHDLLQARNDVHTLPRTDGYKDTIFLLTLKTEDPNNEKKAEGQPG